MAKLSTLIRKMLKIFPYSATKRYNELKTIVDRKNLLKKSLFKGDDQMFLDIIRSCQVYGEYGCGQSTVWTALNTNATILSVDTSLEWIQNVKSVVPDSTRLNDLRWVDVGELANLGKPISFKKRENFIFYMNSIWEKPGINPDLVLIDGRFRVACFLTSLLKSEPGTKIIFDDYVSRPYYHVVEDFIAPIRFCGRQALFIKQGFIDTEKILGEINRFQYVMD